MNPLVRLKLFPAQMYPCFSIRLTIGDASGMDSGQPKAHKQTGNITMYPSELVFSSLVGASDPSSLH